VTSEQSAYQVRLGWGAAGLARMAADADVVVWVDVIADDVLAGHDHAGRNDAGGNDAEHDDAGDDGRDDAGVDPGWAWPPEADVVGSDLHSAGAAAAWVAARQEQLARRLTVAVIAAGHPDHDGGYAVEDHLGAGAFIAALGELGIDATSPDAAVADAAYRAVRPAIGHLVSASTAGRAAGVEPAAYRVRGTATATATATAATAAVRIIQARPSAPDPPRPA
jgi:2-phosphosulfolactate phosphatase